jgi:subtilisin family serine protease
VVVVADRPNILPRARRLGFRLIDDRPLAALGISVLVAAAGNGGPAAPPPYPGGRPEVIAVTAVDQDDTVLPEANRGDYIALAAPGAGIWTPTPDAVGQYRTGTSFATPFVAGAAALELMTGSPAEPMELRRRLADHALHLGPPGRNPIYGYGLVRAARRPPRRNSGAAPRVSCGTGRSRLRRASRRCRG